MDSAQGAKELLIIIFQQHENPQQRLKGNSGSLWENNLQNKDFFTTQEDFTKFSMLIFLTSLFSAGTSLLVPFRAESHAGN